MLLVGHVLLAMVLHSSADAVDISLPTDSQVCEGTFSSPEFYLESPSPGVQCRYEVHAASPSVCGLSLDLGSLRLPSCPSDRLVVAGNPICGSSTGATVELPFREPHTVIYLRGDREEGEGFNITIKQIECSSSSSQQSVSCGGESSSEVVRITSPGYPEVYPTDTECTYTIKQSDPSVCLVEVRFHNSTIEKSINCSKDYLQINNDLLCGEILEVRTYKIDKSLEIKFKTDAEGNFMGFNLTAKQIQCVDTKEEKIVDDRQDFQTDCNHPPGSHAFDSRQGYAPPSRPFPPFPLPNNNLVFNECVPPYNYPICQRIPIEQSPPHVPPFRQFSETNHFYFQNRPYQIQGQAFRPPSQYVPSQSYGPSVVTGTRNTAYSHESFSPPQRQYLPQYPTNNKAYFPNSVYSQPNPTSWYGQSSTRQPYLNNQCCGQIYSDSHFLLVSPGFPRTTTSDCIYTINRYSSLTNQIRFQFRYFWAGEDSGTGCSGGYLEVDGSRICGCKTGTSMILTFYGSESSKILHLKLDYQFNRLFNGFVIEVYQDDSYSQRLARMGEFDSDTVANVTESLNGNVEHINQYVQTIEEHQPVVLPEVGSEVQDRFSYQEAPYGSSRQALGASNNFFCIRWNFQDFLLLIQEFLWAKYQCPASTSISSHPGSVYRSDGSQQGPCRPCNYVCRQNCQCC